MRDRESEREKETERERKRERERERAKERKIQIVQARHSNLRYIFDYYGMIKR